MEMDLGSVILGTIGLAIFALPFIMDINKRKKKEKIFLQSISNIASQYHSKIGQYEIIGSMAIGLDESGNFVCFYSLMKDREHAQSIDLRDIQCCRVLNTGRTIKSKSGNQKIIEKLELSFIPRAKNRPEVRLECFNAYVNTQLSGELQAVEKWSKLINDLLNGKH